MSTTDDSAEAASVAGNTAMENLAGALTAGLPADLGETYLVIGPHAVHGTAPGETFTAVLDTGQERFLIDVGHIRIVEHTPDVTT